MIGGNPLNSHSFSRNKSLAAVLVAIAIPIFTTQLEKSRDSVSVANLRNAYAESQTAILSNGSKQTSAEDITEGNVTIKTGFNFGTITGTVTVANVDIKTMREVYDGCHEAAAYKENQWF